MWTGWQYLSPSCILVMNDHLLSKVAAKDVPVGDTRCLSHEWEGGPRVRQDLL